MCSNSDSSDRDANHEKQCIQQLETVFNKIQESTGEQDINKIVNDFIKREDSNFALYKYVSQWVELLQW